MLLRHHTFSSVSRVRHCEAPGRRSRRFSSHSSGRALALPQRPTFLASFRQKLDRRGAAVSSKASKRRCSVPLAFPRTRRSGNNKACGKCATLRQVRFGSPSVSCAAHFIGQTTLSPSALVRSSFDHCPIFLSPFCFLPIARHETRHSCAVSVVSACALGSSYTACHPVSFGTAAAYVVYGAALQPFTWHRFLPCASEPSI